MFNFFKLNPFQWSVLWFLLEKIQVTIFAGQIKTPTGRERTSFSSYSSMENSQF